MAGGDGDFGSGKHGERESDNAVATGNGTECVGIIATSGVGHIVEEVLGADAEGICKDCGCGIVDREVEVDDTVALGHVAESHGGSGGRDVVGNAVNPCHAVADAASVGARVGVVDSEV